MAGEQLGPGWYPDPAGRADLRWWDGARWTKATRARDDQPTQRIPPIAPQQEAAVRPQPITERPRPEPSAATSAQLGSTEAWAPPATPPMGSGQHVPGPTAPGRLERPRRSRARRTTALIIIAGLALAGVGATAAVFLQLGGEDSDQLVADTDDDMHDPTGGDTPPAPGDEPAEDVAPTDDQFEEDPGTGAAGADQVDELGSLEDDDSLVEEPITIDFDGQCEVTLPLTQAQEDRLRAWDFPECTSAPVALRSDQERWIVVVASLNGDDFTESDARERAAQELGGGVLWSSHYPSLNPNLWVVFDGPYLDEAAARDAANRRGGSAYQRVLSDDEDDRYCLAADGCIGERDR